MTLVEALTNEISFLASQVKNLPYLILDLNNEHFNLKSNPVILYHGHISTNFYMKEIVSVLKKECFTPYCSNYPFWKDLEQTAINEYKTVDQICQKTGKKTSLIGHSLGGLLTTKIAQNNPKLIDKVITLGTPFHGTYLAYLQYPFKSCRQMIPNSDFLKELHQQGFPEEIQFYSIYSPYDHLVKPWRSALLPKQKNTKNLGLIDVSHASLITSERTIVRFLDQ